jgi:hypothetical protein
MNLPHRVGERYTCFVVVREDKGWGGPYSTRRRPTAWECEICGYRIAGDLAGWTKKQMADHREHGHAPCARCGQMLLRRMDGTPRQHAHNRCPGKSSGDKIELEFVKNMTGRTYS